MKIVTTVEALVSALKLSVKLEKKQSIPILANVLLDGNTVTATDLDQWTFVPLIGKVTGKGPFTLPYHQALAVLAGESGALTIEHTPASPTTKTKKAVESKVRLILPECEFAFDSLSTANFPVSPKPAETKITILGNDFRLLLDRVMFAISREQSRYTLNGALFDASGDVALMVGTDGHRLSLAETSKKTGKLSKILIPSAALAYLKANMNGSVSIGADEQYITFRTHGATFITRKLTGQFPDYQAVMPRESKITGTIPSASKLHPILARVAKCADERSGCVMFTFSEIGLSLTAQSSERGSARAVYPAPATGDLKMGLNSTYILEFLKQAGDVDVNYALTDERSAILFSLENWQYLSMPMRM